MRQEQRDQARVALDDVAPIVTELARAMPAALLYPAEHGRFAALVDPILGHIRELAGEGGSFALEVDEAALWAMGCELPEDIAGVRELRDVLVATGVSRVEVDTGARRRDVHALLGRLGQGKRRVEVVGEVGDLAFDDLPATVRARRRDSGRRAPAGDPRARSGPDLSLRSGPAPALPAAGAPQVLRLDALGEAPRPRIVRREDFGPKRTRARLEASQPGAGPKLILHGKANERLPAERGPAARAEVASPPEPRGGEVHERARVPDEGRDALEELVEKVSLLDALLGTGAPTGSERARGTEEPGAPRDSGHPDPRVAEPRAPHAERPTLERDGCELSIEELRRRLEAHARNSEALARSETKERCEELSILLQLLAGTSDPAARRALGSRLGRLLSEGVAGQQREIVHAALHELIAARDVAQIDATLPLLLAPLRHSRVESIGGLLLALLRDGPAEAVGLLWPHVANEVLLGVKHEEPEVGKALLELVGRVPDEVLRAGFGRLTALEALRSGRLSEELLQEPAREVARLLAELLESGESEELGLALLTSFKARPPSRAAEVALAGFATCVPSCRRLLVALLRDRGRGRQTRAANDVAGRILVESLERLAPHLREADTVLEAIAALGGMRHLPARSLLNQIVRERKAVLIPAWPQACREAAQRALRTLGAD